VRVRVCVCVCVRARALARVSDCMYVSLIRLNKEVLFPCNDSKVLGFDILRCILFCML